MKASDMPGERSFGECAAGRDPQYRLFAAQFVEGGVDLVERLAELAGGARGGVGHVRAPATPLKQGHAQAFFQHLDLVAHGRLGHAKFVRRRGESAASGNGFEDSNSRERRRTPHAS